MSLLVAVFVAAGMFAVVWRSRRQYREVLELEGVPPLDSVPSVTVVIPARDEARNIEKCVRSLLPQVAEVVVVDDGSKDATASLAGAAGARVLTAPSRAPGVYGRPNAAYAGSHGVATKWLLFVDADTWYEPGFLAALLERAETGRLDMVSVIPRRRLRSLGEQMITPYCWGIHFTGVNDENVHNLKHPEVLAAGRCILYRADAYGFTGGHRTVLRSPVDDVDLAKLAKRHRLRFEVMRGEDFASVRMADSPIEIVRKFPRLSYQYLVANSRTSMIAGLCSFAMFLYLPALIWLALDGHAIATYIFALTPVAATAPWYRNPAMALFAPVAVCIFPLLALYSVASHYFAFHGWWKGRAL